MDVNQSAAPRGLWQRLRGAPPSAPLEPEADSTSRAIAVMADQLLTPIADFENLAVGPANPQRTSFEFIGPNNAEVYVSHEQAFMQAAVWACIDVTSAAMASSDWNVYAGYKWDDAGKKMLGADQTQFLLNTRMNPEMTAVAAKRALMIAAVGYGNGYAEIQWDMSQRVSGLWPISPDRVTPLRNEFGNLVYRVQQDRGGAAVDVDPVDMFHLRGPSLSGLRGDDMIAKAIQTVAMGIAVDQFAAGYFANGAHVGGILTTRGKLDDAAFEKLQERINIKHRGARKASSTMVMDGGATYVQVDSNAQKADLTNWKYQIIEEVCRWFRVPPHKIAHLLRATNNNIEHQGLEFSRDTLRPYKLEIEQEAQYKLFSPRGPAKFIEIDLDWAEQGDYGSRALAYGQLLNTGVLCVNDVLRKLGENTIGKEGDIRIVQGAMIPLERVGESYRTTGTPTKPQAPDDPTIETPAAPAPGPAAPPAPKPPTKPVKAEAQHEMLATWLASIYARSEKRHRARLAEGKQPTAQIIDTSEHLETAVADILPLLVELSPACTADHAKENAVALGASAIYHGRPLAAAARYCIDFLIDSEPDVRLLP